MNARLLRPLLALIVRVRGRADRESGGACGSWRLLLVVRGGRARADLDEHRRHRRNGTERTEGVTGPTRDGLPGDVSDKVIAAEANGENEGAGEVAENLFDGSSQTKWLVFEQTGWVEATLSEPVAVVHYALVVGQRRARPRPAELDAVRLERRRRPGPSSTRRPNQGFAERFQTKEYRFANATAYTHYRLDITANHGDDIVQLAELQLSNGDTAPPPPSEHDEQGRRRPARRLHRQVGRRLHRRCTAFEYAGTHDADGRGYSYNKVFDVDVPVRSATELSYMIFPEFVDDDLSYPSTYAAVDLAFTDGTYLSDLGARDQHGAVLSPRGQGVARRSTRTSGTTRSRASARSRPARRSTGSSSPTTTPTARPSSAAGSTTSRSPDDPPQRAPAAPVRLRRHRRAARTPPARSRAATTSRRPRCRTASTSGRR